MKFNGDKCRCQHMVSKQEIFTVPKKIEVRESNWRRHIHNNKRLLCIFIEMVDLNVILYILNLVEISLPLEN